MLSKGVCCLMRFFGVKDGSRSFENDPSWKNFRIHISVGAIFITRWLHVWIIYLQGGPLPVINGVIAPISRVVTPITHL